MKIENATSIARFRLLTRFLPKMKTRNTIINVPIKIIIILGNGSMRFPS